jgi:hypothetical protein
MLPALSQRVHSWTGGHQSQATTTTSTRTSFRANTTNLGTRALVRLLGQRAQVDTTLQGHLWTSGCEGGKRGQKHTLREWIRRMATRASGPGGGNSILRSMRPGRRSAESRMSGRHIEPRYATRTRATHRFGPPTISYVLSGTFSTMMSDTSGSTLLGRILWIWYESERRAMRRVGVSCATSISESMSTTGAAIRLAIAHLNASTHCICPQAGL